jgi:hypothetical protein
LPVLAVIRQTVLYLRRHVVLEPWGAVEGPGAGLMGPASPARCPGCGAEARAGETVCSECDSSLDRPVHGSG